MKTFTWLLTLAFAVICFCFWVLSSVAMQAYSDLGTSPPAITSALLRPSGWILFCPVPWVVYSVILSKRREISSDATFWFAGTLFLAAALVAGAVIIALAVAWFPMKAGIHT